MKNNRRTLLKAGAWSAPAIIASATVPAYAASRAQIQSGLFVTTQNDGGFVGYSGSTTSTGHATTPSAYFSAPAGSQEADLNWNDATSKPTNSSSYTNGEGSFTPVTNGGTTSAGSYTTSSGFWFSVPTTSLTSGTSYISGSTATLAAGAVFVTQVEFTIPAGTNASYPGANVTVAGQTWNKQISGTRTAQTSSTAYLQTVTAAGNWVASAPTNTKNADGSYTFRGTITYATTQAITVTQTGTKYYAQTEIMPATVQMYPGYGWNYFQLTSSIQKASISYTANGTTTSTTITGQTTTSRINP